MGGVRNQGISWTRSVKVTMPWPVQRHRPDGGKWLRYTDHKCTCDFRSLKISMRMWMWRGNWKWFWLRGVDWWKPARWWPEKCIWPFWWWGRFVNLYFTVIWWQIDALKIHKKSSLFLYPNLFVFSNKTPILRFRYLRNIMQFFLFMTLFLKISRVPTLAATL